MNNLDLNAMGVSEMSETEVDQIQGGYAPDDGGCIFYPFPILFPSPILKPGFPDIFINYDPTM